MAIFHLPQFEHEPFWQYLSGLNYYHPQYVHFTYEKWEMCKVVLEGITHKTRATLESMCYGDLYSSTSQMALLKDTKLFCHLRKSSDRRF